MDATTLQPSPVSTPAPADLGMDAPPVTLTAKAIEMVKDAIQREGLEGFGIRIGVMGGGCAGFQYSMDFEKEPKDGDLSFEQEGLRLYVDPMSSMYLLGVTVDYVVGLQGAGFKFINPNAKNTCGCGQSFNA